MSVCVSMLRVVYIVFALVCASVSLCVCLRVRQCMFAIRAHVRVQVYDSIWLELLTAIAVPWGHWVFLPCCAYGWRRRCSRSMLRCAGSCSYAPAAAATSTTEFGRTNWSRSGKHAVNSSRRVDFYRVSEFRPSGRLSYITAEYAAFHRCTKTCGSSSSGHVTRWRFSPRAAIKGV